MLVNKIVAYNTNVSEMNYESVLKEHFSDLIVLLLLSAVIQGSIYQQNC